MFCEQIACMLPLIMNTAVDTRNYDSPLPNEDGKAEKLLVMRTERGIISWFSCEKYRTIMRKINASNTFGVVFVRCWMFGYSLLLAEGLIKAFVFNFQTRSRKHDLG